MIRESTLTDEDIKAAANAKLADLTAEAQDKACDTVWSRTMTVTSSTSAAMAVTAPVGAIAGPLGILAWLACAVGIGAAGIFYSKREGEAIYDGDRDALDRWLSDKDFEEFATRAAKVRALAKAAIERPSPASPTSLPNGTPPIPAPVPDHFVDVNKMVEGWQPQSLPMPLVPYLASQIHLLIAATTGSGKTWLLRALCAHLANRGDVICIADPKGTQWGDLAPAVKRMKTGIDYAMLIQDLHRELEARIERLQEGKPVGPHLWAVFDEWFLAKGKCGMLDPDARKAIEIRLLDSIAAGRELNVHLVIVGQSHFLGDLSLGSKNTFSSGLRDNLCTLGLGCKTTKDSSGAPMAGNSKSIDSMLSDQALLRDAADRASAQQFHADLRRQPNVNRTYCLYSSQLFIGQTPDLTIPPLVQVTPFP